MHTTALHILLQNSEYNSLYNALKPAIDEDHFPIFLSQNRVAIWQSEYNYSSCYIFEFQIRKALHVGTQTYHKMSSIVFETLFKKVFTENPAIRWSEKLLDVGYKIMYYKWANISSSADWYFRLFFCDWFIV